MRKFKFLFNYPQTKTMIVSDSGEPNTVSLDQAFEKAVKLSGVAGAPKAELDKMKAEFFTTLEKLEIKDGLKIFNEHQVMVCLIIRVKDDYSFFDMLEEEYGDF